MSYIRLFENLAVLEKWYGMESRSVMEPAVLLLVSLPCTIGIELRSYIYIYILCIIKNGRSESKKVNF